MPEMVLLISDNKENDLWCQLLREALTPLYSLEIQHEETILECVARNRYALIIVDAQVARDMPGLISCLRSHESGVRVVVVSASPTWERARDAFRAGAIDYIRKSLSKRELRELFTDILTRISLSSSH